MRGWGMTLSVLSSTPPSLPLRQDLRSAAGLPHLLEYPLGDRGGEPPYQGRVPAADPHDVPGRASSEGLDCHLLRVNRDSFKQGPLDYLDPVGGQGDQLERDLLDVERGLELLPY